MRISLGRLLACTVPFLLTACDSVGDWVNGNMPVIGQRCENWQCFTSSGQEQSQLNRQERVQREAAEANGTSAAPTPGGAPAPAAMAAAPAPASAPAPAQPAAPAMSATPTYTYVPRAPAAPGTTPFDGGAVQPVEQ